jgi:alkylhydroperoxidase family enzyme
VNAVAFLALPEPGAEARRVFDDDVAELGYVMNATRLWAYRPGVFTGLFDLMQQAVGARALTVRQRGILVAACASTLGDSYCSLAWGRKLAGESDARTAAGVLRGDDSGLTDPERAMARWARQVARDPNGTTEADVQALRDAGFGDEEIFAITVYVALRLALSTVNDALGVRPDAALRTTAPGVVVDAVTFGRPIADQPRGAAGTGNNVEHFRPQ